jgi:asparaginyl-tRNA synthetase
MVEPEIAYADLDDIMNLTESFLGFIVSRVLEGRQEELKILERDTAILEKLVPPFPRISYDDAVIFLQGEREKLLNSDKEEDRKLGESIISEWGGDFGAPDETLLSGHYDKPLLVHRYPADIKAFYMKRDPEDDRLALCLDVLAPEGVGEIIGGGQRADSLDYLEKQIEAHKLPKESFEWFLDLRRYGTVPHGGFGLGVERTCAWLCGTEHVRETIPFPRMLHRIYP